MKPLKFHLPSTKTISYLHSQEDLRERGPPMDRWESRACLLGSQPKRQRPWAPIVVLFYISLKRFMNYESSSTGQRLATMRKYIPLEGILGLEPCTRYDIWLDSSMLLLIAERTLPEQCPKIPAEKTIVRLAKQHANQ